MMLSIYNSLTRRKDVFVPRESGRVGMYVCGMTVYDYCHVGHARVLVVFDMIYRYLRHLGYQVTYVRNITDIDDKIIQRAQEQNESITTLTERFIAAMHEDAAALDVLPPEHEPRATEHIATIQSMITALLARGHAYLGANGDVYYAVASFPAYGQLSGKSLPDLQAGTRVDIDSYKRNPLDFVLWKAAKPSEPAWESPWGAGRPGWHIECSAMSTHCLGSHFDIHGGGADLQFPHHENEIAQACGATGEPFVNVWMHNGFVRINEEKMSKSLGNFFTVRDVLARYPAETVRYFILASHYRSPLNYSDAQLDQAQMALSRLYTALRDLPKADAAPANAQFSTLQQRFAEAMADDFNTPEALAVLFEVAREINRLRQADALSEASAWGAGLRQLGSILGLLGSPADVFLCAQAAQNVTLTDDQIEELIAKRTQARQQRQWQAADQLRDQLHANGIIVEDVAGQTRWRRQF
jgi:cysteinyl-tRNA synthetase